MSLPERRFVQSKAIQAKQNDLEDMNRILPSQRKTLPWVTAISRDIRMINAAIVSVVYCSTALNTNFSSHEGSLRAKYTVS